MQNYQTIGTLKVARPLFDFVNNEALPSTGVDQRTFWASFESLLIDLSPKNRALLQRRVELQEKIDDWHRQHQELAPNPDAHREFLREIGYILPPPPPFLIDPQNVDEEISSIPGPQLVVPVMNARYSINAANARWGSLYDALYGSNAIPECDGGARGAHYNPVRGQRVIAFGRRFLDQAVPLATSSHAEVAFYSIRNGSLTATLESGETSELADRAKFVGYRGACDSPSALLLRNNELHIHIDIDHDHDIGARDQAGVSDIVLEAAVTTIMDCEDSVAAVDADDKAIVYRNWLGLMKGNLTASFTKQGEKLERNLAPDLSYLKPNGGEIVLPGRSLMLVRNVGHLMTSDAICFQDDQEAPEGLIDAMITSLCAIHDLNRPGGNSRAGSVYIVKPKMHGPEEVAFADEVFSRVEDALNLERNTLKIGIMDEERRTSLNLARCIHAAKSRVIFINTGFLDRTGDEIHTAREAGPVVRKQDMKSETWITAYEDNNVDVGLACGFAGRAQIGKGMWAMPDEMSAMLEQKIDHPMSGANTAWAPSPTAATLHATHYHLVDVKERQKSLAARRPVSFEEMLCLPLLGQRVLSETDIQSELELNAQSILGYVVRWIDQGVGCSKVPDINDIGLMEDRATLRISSQHLSNWLRHGLVDEAKIFSVMVKMAAVVDEQNSTDAQYIPMANDPKNSHAFRAALELVYRGADQPSGYTEPILHKRRREVKSVSGKPIH